MSVCVGSLHDSHVLLLGSCLKAAPQALCEPRGDSVRAPAGKQRCPTAPQPSTPCHREHWRPRHSGNTRGTSKRRGQRYGNLQGRIQSQSAKLHGSAAWRRLCAPRPDAQFPDNETTCRTWTPTVTRGHQSPRQAGGGSGEGTVPAGCSAPASLPARAPGRIAPAQPPHTACPMPEKGRQQMETTTGLPGAGTRGVRVKGKAKSHRTQTTRARTTGAASLEPQCTAFPHFFLRDMSQSNLRESSCH